MSDFTEQNERWILNFESGRNWINKLPSYHTKRIFIRALQKYCLIIKQTPDELINLKIEGLKAVATEKEFIAERQLEKYLEKATMTQSVKEMSKNAIISFYKHNWRNLNPNVASNIEKPEAKKRTPKIEDIQIIESNMTNARDKAIVWFFASTAVRIGTLIKLCWNDLKSTNDPDVPYNLEIEAKRLKGAGFGRFKGLKQITFVHKLTVQKLEEYRAETKRKGYDLKPDSPLFIGYKNSHKVKAITQPAINSAFDNASLSAWHDLEVKRFSPHDIRDFMQTQLENADINANIIAPIMAHKTKNAVDSHYSSHDVASLLEKYKSALNYLLPLSVEKLKGETDQLKTETTQLRTENETLKTKYDELEDKFEAKLAETMRKAFDAINQFQKEAQTANKQLKKVKA